MEIKNICFDLASVPATAGYEDAVVLKLKSYIEKHMPCYTDRLGNLIGTIGEGELHILLDAHIDQVGLVVRGIDDKGFLLIDKIGSADIRTLTGAEVTVHANKELFGVICSVPPHLQSGDGKADINISTMAVDIGFSKAEVEKLVKIGDRITLRNFQYELLGNNISSSAFDDRCCAAVIIGVLDLIKDKLKNVKLSVSFSTQEEVGCRGAGAAAFALKPDYAVVLDVGFGDDPYTDKASTIALGKGPSIGISPVLDKNFTDEITDIAERKGIPYQHDVMGARTGTDADVISNSCAGVKTALISVPLRYMHTANEIINIDDVINTVKLVAEIISEKERQSNA
ncbi:MAG: M20/M25/M40 family metallo-hydrolase [Clostridia bacterium]|nr:M20/M25/M40 family metallo-hydrolase [Clostridia bacterium]